MQQSEKENLVLESLNSDVKNRLYPVFLKLEKMHTLVVGAGFIGLEKLHSLLYNSPDARITIVAISVSDEVRHFVQQFENIEIIEREFEADDLNEKDLVIAATGNKNVNAFIKKEAENRKILINVADTPALCDFYLGSIVQKGDLKIAISTNGKSPTAAKRIREYLDESLTDEFDDTLENLNAIRQQLKGNFADKVKKLNQITNIHSGLLLRKEKSENWTRVASFSILVFGSMLIGYFLFSYLPMKEMAEGTMNIFQTLDSKFPWMIVAGFAAQLVDGALGMGYGVTSATILLSLGVNLAAISGSIHTAEMFASGASGYSHYKFGNVNKKLFRALLIPGVLGAVLGAFLLVKFGETHAKYLKPVMAIYTLFLGIRIFINAFRKQQKKTNTFKRYGLLAGAGGFLDSFGGGGWGPIVTTTLITKGRTPKYVIGSVSITEFFVTLASAFTFFTLLGLSHWQTILGLIIGGLIAAPIAARLAGKLPRKASLILLGLLVMFWSFRILVKLF